MITITLVQWAFNRTFNIVNCASAGTEMTYTFSLDSIICGYRETHYWGGRVQSTHGVHHACMKRIWQHQTSERLYGMTLSLLTYESHTHLKMLPVNTSVE